jgi:hypothetical protein
MPRAPLACSAPAAVFKGKVCVFLFCAGLNGFAITPGLEGALSLAAPDMNYRSAALTGEIRGFHNIDGCLAVEQRFSEIPAIVEVL